MARRISASQFRSKMRQAQQKQRQAINKYNQAVRKHNQNVKTAVNKYNQEVRAHNSRVRANRQRLKSELARLQSQSSTTTTTRFVAYRTSVETLNQSYSQLENRVESRQHDPRFDRVLDLSERETANSLEVTNRILGVDGAGDTPAEQIENAQLHDGLARISDDLNDRWKGAVFALNPTNPDAARHFCTSAREVITQILEIKAPDSDVFAILPDCDTTDRGNPTRRSKIKYFLHKQGLDESSLEEFVENDIENIVQLFRVFNDGTHGSAGTFDLQQLHAIKTRVEDGIVFLTEIIGDA
ncbi:hypothetical protein V6x_54470 [Gimesia chilikensis]|uniref:Predicted pPIWI-associating nuclease domain-containing protein n=1 Tax=Gimesia chilikensis TaxID=2605989 RepID=A0A517WKB5_9PLAN|nr:hypothetical protein [Gimesia chilikensis]QDU05706.1 hypothetical protein V6x_54470 [Gimesia chilikensis]